ncbi:hypothetical protein P43SY_004756 [Pythium insidiosum]|uniref:PH domain-containing protein n=1 Tax=Pythium insidiosum TaxID=114742 RepID=A0AAD5LRI6_PYTIN|nr:hypothetical protein P43SY_004756 [Pythium insidiosum]
MQGFLDHVELVGATLGLAKKKRWTRRFCRLNAAFHTLECFADAQALERTGRIELRGAQVATAEELGELLASGAQVSIENSRRFVFRVTEPPATKGGHSTHHYLCAELPNEGAAASREYLARWLQALRAAVAQASAATPEAVAPVDLRELNAKITAFQQALHVSARVSRRTEDAHGKGQYELAAKAWVLQRELVDDDWQVLEYSCDWTVVKTTAEFKAFDGQLRQFFSEQLRDLVLPAMSGVHKLLHVHSAAQQAEENERRAAQYDQYLQELLQLPAFSVFGSDGGAMLDRFLELSPHLGSFKQIERDSGQNLQLRNKRVVPWAERQRFELLYRLHLEVARSQEMLRARQQRARMPSSARSETSVRQHSHHHHHHHRHHSYADSEDVEGEGPGDTEDVAPPEDSKTEPLSPSVHDRIARIGHRLLVEAFQVSASSPRAAVTTD